jgi:hypothetical protein
MIFDPHGGRNSHTNHYGGRGRGKTNCNTIRNITDSRLVTSEVRRAANQPNLSYRLSCISFQKGLIMLVYGIELLADLAGRHETESISHPWQAWYKSPTWKAVKRHRLIQEPNCRCCAQEGRTVMARFVGHVEPHRGRWSRFIQYENTQSLCAHHHKQQRRI